MLNPFLNETTTASVRYFVNDMDAAVAFYHDILGFEVIMHPNPFFAMLSRKPLRLILSHPGGGAGGGQAMSDGAVPKPGGWNRISLGGDDIENAVEELKKQNAHFRNEIVIGIGGKQILLLDPSGNLVELFQSTS